MKKMKIAFTILALAMLLSASPAQAQETPEPQEDAGVVSLYVWAPGGLYISWEDPPKQPHPDHPVEYSCTLAIRNLVGHYFIERTEDYQWVNDETIRFKLIFYFDGEYWVIVGGEDESPTSYCEAITDRWGDSETLDKSYFRDFRFTERIFLPIVVR